MKDERQKFLEEEWPRVHATIQRLGFSAADLLAAPPAAKSAAAKPVSPAADDGTHNESK